MKPLSNNVIATITAQDKHWKDITKKGCYKVIDTNKTHDNYGHIANKQVKQILAQLGKGIRGETSIWIACAISKAKLKAVKKTTETKAAHPGKHVLIDTTDPFNEGIEGIKY